MRQMGRRLPAEWEPQSGVQLTWPHADSDWKYCLDDITQTFICLTRAIARFEPVLIVMPDEEHVSRFGGLLPDRNIVFAVCPSDDTWARDHGFICVESVNDDGTFALLDFHFNGWGEKFAAERDNAINARLFSAGAFNGFYENSGDFVLEGGSIESDGKGTIFTTSGCLLAPHRNEPLGKLEIERELMNRLGAKRVVWLDHGSLIGDDTDGHIDTIVRLAPDDTLVYVGCDDAADPQYKDFLALEGQLQSLRTMEGEPYRLLRLPMPDAIVEDRERLPATYANFLIINGAVICPTYGQQAKDRQALDTIQIAFPDREVIPIDARTIIRQHGSVHCLTMQFPAGVLR